MLGKYSHQYPFKNLIQMETGCKAASKIDLFSLTYTFTVLILKPKLSRHIRLNPTNIALLLQEATQNY